jgi:hypothetical protein
MGYKFSFGRNSRLLTSDYYFYLGQENKSLDRVAYHFCYVIVVGF